MTSVKDWYRLGDYYSGLCVPRSVCDEIRYSTTYKTEDEKKAAFLQYFLDNVPMASWQTVAGALHYREEKKALQMVQAFLPPSGESILVPGDVLPLLVTVGKLVALNSAPSLGAMTFDPDKQGECPRYH